MQAHEIAKFAKPNPSDYLPQLPNNDNFTDHIEYGKEKIGIFSYDQLEEDIAQSEVTETYFSPEEQNETAIRFWMNKEHSAILNFPCKAHRPADLSSACVPRDTL